MPNNLGNPVADDPYGASQVIGGINYKSRIFLLSMGFFFLFMAFNAAQALATSISAKQGHIDLAALYGTFALACIFAPKAIDIFGPRLSMVLGGLPYIGMIISNLSTDYEVTVPMNVAVGLGAPLLWTGQGVYLSRCAMYYSAQAGLSKEKATTYFNGIFWTLYQLNGTIGLVTSSLVLIYEGDNHKFLFYGLGASAALGVFVLTLLSDVPAISALAHNANEFPVAEDAHHTHANDHYNVHEEQLSETSSVTLCETLKLLSNPKMLLLVPIIFYNGLSLGFLFGDFTQDGSSRALGLDKTGFVVASFFFSNAIATQIWSHAANSGCGRRGVCVFACMFHVAFYSFFFLWEVPENFDENNHKLQEPTMEDYALIFSGAVVFAIGDAVWESQVPAILQSMFSITGHVDAAMANLKLWQSLGFAVQFYAGIYLSWSMKLIVLLGFQVMGAFCLMCVHFRLESIDEVVDTNGYSDDYVYTDYNPDNYLDDDDDYYDD